MLGHSIPFLLKDRKRGAERGKERGYYKSERYIGM